MPTTLRDRAGRYAGSVGDGAKAAPSSPSTAPVAPPAPAAGALDLDALADAYAALHGAPAPWKADRQTNETFTLGGCWILAEDLHRTTGWPLVLVATSAKTRPDGATAYGWVHVLVRSPDGRLIDVEGVHDPADVWGRWGEIADDAAADDAEHEAEAGDPAGAWPDLVEVHCTGYAAATSVSRDDPDVSDLERNAIAASPSIVERILGTWFPAGSAASAPCLHCC
jgi:hypothetical protein